MCVYAQSLRCGPPARSSIPKSVSGWVDRPFTTVVIIIGKREEKKKTDQHKSYRIRRDARFVWPGRRRKKKSKHRYLL